jgi:hypothetical protein
LQRKDIYSVHSSGGSRAYHQHVLGSGERIIVDSITMRGVHERGRGHITGQEITQSLLRACPQVTTGSPHWAPPIKASIFPLCTKLRTNGPTHEPFGDKAHSTTAPQCKLSLNGRTRTWKILKGEHPFPFLCHYLSLSFNTIALGV